MFKPEETFADYDTWVRAAQDRGYHGPFRIQGHQQFEFTRPYGLDRKKVAHWDGMETKGVLFGDTLEQIPEGYEKRTYESGRVGGTETQIERKESNDEQPTIDPSNVGKVISTSKK